MSVQMDSSTEMVELFVPLLNEGTDVVRPTQGHCLGNNEVEVLATLDYDPDVEEWKFPPGTKVACETETRAGRKLLVAQRKT